MGEGPTPPARALDPARLRLGLLAVAAIGAEVAIGVAVLTGGGAMLAQARGLPGSVVVVALAINAVSWLAEGVVFASLAGLRGARGLVRGTLAYVGGGFPGLVTPFGSGALPGWAFALVREGASAGEAAAVLGIRGLLTSLFFVAAGVVAVATLPARLAGSGGGPWVGLAALLGVFAVTATVVARPERAAGMLGRVLSGRVVRRVAGTGRSERWAAAASREAERFATTLRQLATKRPAALLAALAGLVVSRACLLAILPIYLVGLGWRGDLLPVLVTVVAVWALASGSPTPGGSGTVEAAMAAALSAQAPVRIAGAAALLWRGTTFYVDLFVGWVIFARYLTADPKKAPRRAG